MSLEPVPAKCFPQTLSADQDERSGDKSKYSHQNMDSWVANGQGLHNPCNNQPDAEQQKSCASYKSYSHLLDLRYQLGIQNQFSQY